MYTLFWRVPGVHIYGAKNQINVPVGATVSDKASIRFTGKGAANTGKIQQENLMRLTENFAGPTPPAYPTVGQNWYDTSTNQLKVCVASAPQPETWVAVGSGVQSTGPNEPPPENPSVGDLWMQELGVGSGILYFYTGTGRYPETAAGVGGWEQVFPTVERHAGREEYESMMALVEQLIGPASTRGSGAAGRAITGLTDIGKLDRSMRQAWSTNVPNDTNTLLAIANEPYVAFQASSRNRLAIKTNYSSFTTRDYNELYLCGFNLSSIAMEDIDGGVYINDVLVTVPRGSCYTGNIFTDALIIWDTTSTLTSAVGPSHFFVARKNGSSWQYDQSGVPGTWTNFTPQAGMFAIGIATTVALDTGSPGTAPGVVSATAWDNAVELMNASISALKIEPNANDWDQLLAAAKYALSRLDFPNYVVDDISPMPFVNDGRAVASNLMGLSPSDVRFPSQERRSNRHIGAVTMNRMFTETTNVLNMGISSRYILGGMLGTSGTKSTFAPNISVDSHAMVLANASASGGVFGQATRTTGVIIRFNNRDELERFFYAGQALQLRVTHAPATNTAADLNLKGLADGYGLVRLLADRSLTMISTGTPALNAAVGLAGGVDLTASPTTISSSTYGTATLQVTAKALTDTDLQLELFVLAGGVTSGTFTAEWSIVNDNETWAGGRVYPGVLPYAAGTDFIAGNFTDTTPIAPLVIQTQPQSSTVNTGNVVTFGVVATGAGPIGYQWKKNGVDIVGATSSSYSFTVANADNGAVFSVVVTNPYSSVTSSNATLTVTSVAAPTITMVPNVTILAGNGGSIGTYTGTPSTISITKNGTPITNMTELFVSGGSIALNSNVGLSSNGAVYAVTLSNAGGTVSGSTTVTVTPRTFTLQQNNPSWTEGYAQNVRLASELGSDAGISNAVITSGSLPAGVTQAGVFGWVTGAPSSAGPYNFTVTYYPYADMTNVASRVFNYSGTVASSYTAPQLSAYYSNSSSVPIYAGSSLYINATPGSLPMTHFRVYRNSTTVYDYTGGGTNAYASPVFGLSDNNLWTYSAEITETGGPGNTININNGSPIGVQPQNMNDWTAAADPTWFGPRTAPVTYGAGVGMVVVPMGSLIYTAPIGSFSVVSGSLPPGVTMSASGGGVPTMYGGVSTAGSWSITLRLFPIADRCVAGTFKDVTINWTFT